MLRTGSQTAACWPACSAEMAAAPAAAAVLSDLLWCLGLGCLLGMARQILGLVLGEGPVRCFCWDVLTFAAAAVLVCGFAAGVSASGLARWYMAAGVLAGVLAWYATIGPALSRLLRGLLRLLLWPLRILEQRCLGPLRRAATRRLRKKTPLPRSEKSGKKAKKRKKPVAKAVENII